MKFGHQPEVALQLCSFSGIESAKSVPVRQKPLSIELGRLVRGVVPHDGGALSNISTKEALRIRAADPVAARFLRPYITSSTLVRGVHRWCLRMAVQDGDEVGKSHEIRSRVDLVVQVRPPDFHLPPWVFVEEDAFPHRIIVVPRRIPRVLELVPVRSFDQGEVAGDQVWIISENHLLTAGVVASRMYRVWLSEVSRASGPEIGVGSTTAHNTFPLPELSESQRTRIEEASERMLLARSFAMDSDLNELYSRVDMPKPLREAHDDIDAVLAEVFGIDVESSDAQLRSALNAAHEKLLLERQESAA